MTKPHIIVEPATVDDIPAIHKIHSFYVSNTVLTFHTEGRSEQELHEAMKTVQAAGLPYIVAKLPNGEVVGYTFVSGFRNSKRGYRRTVELSIFCHPDYRHVGIGSKLLTKLLAVLADPESNKEFAGKIRDEKESVRQVLAVMAYDPETVNSKFDLKGWYESFGFMEVGHLREVGHKFDRWIDILYLQKSLW